MAPTETVQILIQSLLNAGVKYVFGVPGAKIDSVFNALLDHPEIKLIVCRHEQNAAFIAGAIGKLTGVPGVCVVTSGPGTSNLVTGLVTANDEGSPIVALTGAVKRVQSTKKTHQSLRAVELLAPVTKKMVEVLAENQVAEIILDCFRVAISHPHGATAVSLPIDIMSLGAKSSVPAFPPAAFTPPAYGPSTEKLLNEASKLIESAKFPVLFLGMRAAGPQVVHVVHEFLRAHPIPVVETFQAAGSISKELAHLFYGRVGLFRNRPGDKVLSNADLVIAIGYNQAEYDANLWNTSGKSRILSIDYIPSDYGTYYAPVLELIGCIATNLTLLSKSLRTVSKPQETQVAKDILTEFHSWPNLPEAQPKDSGPVHPLYFIRLLQSMISSSTTVISDVGSIYIWLSRYFFSYEPNTFLVSNAQQTLGVSLPWAIAANLAQSPPCSKKVVSVSGDGGLMFSAQELATAVQQKCQIAHFVWNDGHYNMVEFQEVDKYGRSAGIELGGVDFVKLAETFGAKGLRVSSAGDMERVMKEALVYDGVCLVDVEIDYRQNHDLMRNVITDSIS